MLSDSNKVVEVKTREITHLPTLLPPCLLPLPPSVRSFPYTHSKIFTPHTNRLIHAELKTSIFVPPTPTHNTIQTIAENYNPITKHREM